MGKCEDGGRGKERVEGGEGRQKGYELYKNQTNRFQVEQVAFRNT